MSVSEDEKTPPSVIRQFLMDSEDDDGAPGYVIRFPDDKVRKDPSRASRTMKAFRYSIQTDTESKNSIQIAVNSITLSYFRSKETGRKYSKAFWAGWKKMGRRIGKMTDQEKLSLVYLPPSYFREPTRDFCESEEDSDHNEENEVEEYDEHMDYDNESLADLRCAAIILRSAPHVKEFSLCESRFGSVGGVSFLDDFADALQLHQSIEKIAIDGGYLKFMIPVDDVSRLLPRAILSLPKLQCIDFPEMECDFDFFDSDQIYKLVCKPTMRTLSFRLHWFKTEETSLSFFSAMASSDCKVETIVIKCHHESTTTGVAFFSPFAKALDTNRSLTTVRLTNPVNLPGGSEMDAGRLLGIALGRHASLVTFDLTLWQPGGTFEFYGQLISGLAASQTLRHLMLHGLSWTKETCDALRQVLQTSQLTCLFVDMTSHEEWLNIVPSLAVARGVKYLGIRSNFMKSDNMEIGRAVLLQVRDLLTSHWKSLEHLLIRFSQLECPVMLLQALLVAVRSTRLDLLEINMAFDGKLCSKQFYQAMRSNFYLSCFSSDCLFYESETVDEALEVFYSSMAMAILEMNAAGRKYVLDDAKNKRKAMDVLASVSTGLDWLYFHLRENTSICSRDIHQDVRDRKTTSVLVVNRKHPAEDSVQYTTRKKPK